MRHNDQYTLTIMVAIDTNLGDQHHGESIHTCGCKFGFESDNYIRFALIMMYVKIGSSQNEWKVLNTVNKLYFLT